MNWNDVQNNWNEYCSSAQQQWNKITLKQFEAMNGDRDQLYQRLQETYGVNYSEANRQIDQWHSDVLKGKDMSSQRDSNGNKTQSEGKTKTASSNASDSTHCIKGEEAYRADDMGCVDGDQKNGGIKTAGNKKELSAKDNPADQHPSSNKNNVNQGSKLASDNKSQVASKGDHTTSTRNADDVKQAEKPLQSKNKTTDVVEKSPQSPIGNKAQQQDSLGSGAHRKL